MKNITTFEFDNPVKGVWMPLVLGFLGIFWIILCTMAWKDINVSSGSKFWILFAVIVLNSTNSFLHQNLFAGANVLHGLRTPRPLWKAYLNGASRSAFMVGFLVCAAMVTLVIMAIPSWSLLTMAAVLSTVMCFTTLSILASHGKMHHVFLWTARIFSAVFIVALISKINLEIYLSNLDRIPTVLRWLLVFSWPALTVATLGSWRHHPPIRNTSFGEMTWSAKEKMYAYLQRFTGLNFMGQRLKYKYSDQTSEKFSGIFLNTLMLSSFFLNMESAKWDNTIGPSRLMVVITFAMIVCNCMVFKDLHWRYILAPNHLLRRGLGWHIFKYSAALQFISLLVVACVVVFFSLGFLNRSWTEIISGVWQHRLMPFELMAATACAVLISAKAIKTVWQIVSFIGLVVLLWAVMLISFGSNEKWPVWPISDAAYAAILLTVSAILIIISNKLWTAKRLVSALRAA